jgi:hypothetical protein
MKILVYSQFGGLGGSTRLLLNLARFLGNYHSVAVALAGTATPQATSALLRHFSDVKRVPSSAQAINNAGFDLALLHLPFSLEALDTISVPRKIAVVMELVERHPIPLTEGNCGQLERLLYLHPEQVSHLSSGFRESRCRLLPLINNIDFEPAYVKTRFMGVVGGAHKTGVAQVLRFIAALPPDFGLRMWSDSALSLQGLAAPMLQQALGFIGAGRLIGMPAEIDVRVLMRSYDALLHLPRHGNGTSVVVSDALYCGKPIVVSSLPSYKSAYAGMEGVLFSDAPIEQLIASITRWSEADFRRISDAYRAVYNREQALQLWRRALEE